MGATDQGRTVEDEVRGTLLGCTVEEVKVRGGDAYARLSSPDGSERFVSFDAASLRDVRSAWPE